MGVGNENYDYGENRQYFTIENKLGENSSFPVESDANDNG